MGGCLGDRDGWLLVRQGAMTEQRGGTMWKLSETKYYDDNGNPCYGEPRPYRELMYDGECIATEIWEQDWARAESLLVNAPMTGKVPLIWGAGRLEDD